MDNKGSSDARKEQDGSDDSLSGQSASALELLLGGLQTGRGDADPVAVRQARWVVEYLAGGLATAARHRPQDVAPEEHPVPSRLTILAARLSPEVEIRLGELLEWEGYGLEVCEGEQLISRLQSGAGPALACFLDIGSHSPDELEALALAASGTGTCLVGLGETLDLEGRVAAMAAGVEQFVDRRLDSGEVARLLGNVAKPLPSVPWRVLLLSEDGLFREAVAALLGNAGIDVLIEPDARQSLARMRDTGADLVLFDDGVRTLDAEALLDVLAQEAERLGQGLVRLTRGDGGALDGDLRRQARFDVLEVPIQPWRLVWSVSGAAARARRHGESLRSLRQTLYELRREHTALNEHAIVSIASVAGNIIYANDLFCQISGYSRDELLGQNHRILNSGVHSCEFFEEMWRTISKGRSWTGEICNRRKDGRPYWVKSTIVPFLDERGRPYQYVSIRTDITQLKEAEARLRRDQELKQMVSELASTFLVAEACDKDEVFLHALEVSSGYMAADQACIVLFDEQEREIRHAYDWHAIENRNEDAADHCSALAEMPWWRTQLRQLDYLAFPSVDEMPAAAAHESAYLRSHGLNAILAVPLRNEEQMFGYLCYQSSASQPYWTPESLEPGFTILGKVFSGALGRWRVEEALRVSEERLRRSQVAASFGTWDWNIQTGELYWSEPIAEMFGYPDGELETRYENFVQSIHPEDREAVLQAVDNCVKHGDKYHIEHRCVWPDGTVRWLLERGDVTRAPDGTPIRMLGVVHDITGRKAVENQLAEERRKLTEAQERASLGNWEMDAVTGSLNCSPVVARIFGHAAGTLPTIDAFLLAVHEADLPALRAGRRAAIRHGFSEVNIRISRPDGETRHLHMIIESRRSAAGKVERFVGTIQDVTAMKLAEERAERANAAKSEFLSRMSHELRTPMNAVLGFAQLLQSDVTLSEQQQDSIQEILRGGEHLLTLINDILDLAKIEAGKVDFSIEPVDVRELVAECFTLLRPLAEEHGLALLVDGLDGLVVRADRVRLKQSLLNLLSNGIKYNRPGGSVKVTGSTAAAGELVRLTVIDTGCGIPADELGHLFAPFTRAGAAQSKIEGTGIGLTITRQLIENMKGAIGVSSEVGIGSSFWIELPADELRFLSRHEAGPKESGSRLPLAKNSKVLYFGDNPSNQRLAEELVTRRPGLELLCADSPETGLEIARVHRPGLILLDTNMPGMDGYEVLRSLRKQVWAKDVPVVAVSANAMPGDIRRGRAAGFAAYLTKPINVARFFGIIDRYLGTAGREADAVRDEEAE